MTATQTTITPSYARRAIVEIIRNHPDQVNPTAEGGACLYTDEQDASRHCLVGQFMVEVFGFCPTPDDPENYSYNADQLFLWEGRWSQLVFDAGFEVLDETAHWLQSLQFRADEATHGGLSWKDIELPPIPGETIT